MKIDSNLPASAQIGPIEGAAAVARTAEPGSSAAAHASASVATDTATLSSAAAAMQQAGPSSDVRMEKVQSMQQALAAGTYQVSTGEVADRLIDSMLKP